MNRKNIYSILCILLILLTIISCSGKISGKLLTNIQGLPKKAIYKVQIYQIIPEKLQEAFEVSSQFEEFLMKQPGFLDMSVFTDQSDDRIVVFLAWKDYQSAVDSDVNFYSNSDLGPKLLSYCSAEPIQISATNRTPLFIGKGKVEDDKVYLRLTTWSFKQDRPVDVMEMGKKLFKWFSARSGFVGLVLFDGLGDSFLPILSLQIFDSAESMQNNIEAYDQSDVSNYFLSFYKDNSYVTDLRLIPLKDFILEKSEEIISETD